MLYTDLNVASADGLGPMHSGAIILGPKKIVCFSPPLSPYIAQIKASPGLSVLP